MNRKTDTKPHFYAQTSQPDGKSKLMHRMIMGNPNGLVIDHINRNTCDNRKANLRCCKQSENGANANLSSANKSGRKGVCLVKDYAPGVDKWKAFIMVNRVNHNLGFFDSFEEAVKRREEAELKFHRHLSQLSLEMEAK